MWHKLNGVEEKNTQPDAHLLKQNKEIFLIINMPEDTQNDLLFFLFCPFFASDLLEHSVAMRVRF